MGTMGHEGTVVVAWDNTTEAVVSESPLKFHSGQYYSVLRRQCGLIEEKKRGRVKAEMWEMQRILNAYSYHVSRRNAGTDNSNTQVPGEKQNRYASIRITTEYCR